MSTLQRRGLRLLLARTGARLGEALALRWDDLDVDARTIRVERGFSDGRIETPKTHAGRGRRREYAACGDSPKVACPPCLRDATARLAACPEYVFITADGTPLDPSRVRKVMMTAPKARAAALLAARPASHAASLLLQQGESPAYVQRQLGHASIKLTGDTYGKWLPMGKKAAVDAPRRRKW